MPDDQTKILIEMQLDVKNLKSQMDKQTREFDKYKKKVSELGKAAEKSSKGQGKAADDAAKQSKKAAQEAAKAEKAKQQAINEANKAIKEQIKLLREQAKEQAKAQRNAGLKGFAGGMLAGAGLGMLTRPVTARGIGGFMGRGLSAGIGGVLNFGVQGAAATYQQAMAFGAAKGGLIGMGVPSELRGATGQGVRLGYNPIETMMQARMIGQATGNIGAVTRAQEISRGYGVDVGQVGGFMGMIRQAGYGFGGATGYGRAGREGEKTLSKAMEAGIVSGLEKGRLPEFIQGVARVSQQVGGQVAGRVNVADISAFQAMLGRTGLAGFKGARGAAVTAQLGQAIMRPGGGEAGQAMMLQALGFGKPGGQRTYYEALRMQQQGMQRPETVRDLFTEVYSQLGQVGAGGRAPVQQEANIALSEMTGLSLQQVEELGELLNSGQATEEEMAKVREILEETKDPQKLALEEMKKGFGGIVQYQAQIAAQQIAIGSKSIELFTTIQKAQLKALDYLTNYIPTIVDLLKKIWSAIAAVGKVLGLGEDERAKMTFMDVMKETEKDVAEAYATSLEGKTAVEREKILKGRKSALKSERHKLLSKMPGYDPERDPYDYLMDTLDEKFFGTSQRQHDKRRKSWALEENARRMAEVNKQLAVNSMMRKEKIATQTEVGGAYAKMAGAMAEMPLTAAGARKLEKMRQTATTFGKGAGKSQERIAAELGEATAREMAKQNQRKKGKSSTVRRSMAGNVKRHAVPRNLDKPAFMDDIQ